jgi:hypothetical protein
MDDIVRSRATPPRASFEEPGTGAFELPLPDTKRWVAGRKAIVVAAVRSGELTFQDACQRYELSPEEFLV